MKGESTSAEMTFYSIAIQEAYGADLLLLIIKVNIRRIDIPFINICRRGRKHDRIKKTPPPKKKVLVITQYRGGTRPLAELGQSLLDLLVGQCGDNRVIIIMIAKVTVCKCLNHFVVCL